MRVLTQGQRMRATRAELMALLRRIASELHRTCRTARPSSPRAHEPAQYPQGANAARSRTKPVKVVSGTSPKNDVCRIACCA